MGLFMTVLSFFGKRYIEKIDALEDAEAEASATRRALTARVDAMDERMKQEHKDNQNVQQQILEAVNRGNVRIDDIWKEFLRGRRRS